MSNKIFGQESFKKILDLHDSNDIRENDYWHPITLIRFPYEKDDKSGITYFFDKESMSAVAFIGSKLKDQVIKVKQTYDFERKTDNGYDRVNMSKHAKYGNYTVKYVYVRASEWDMIRLPSSVEDVVIDRYKYTDVFLKCNIGASNIDKIGGKFSVSEESDFLSVDGKYSLYNKEKTRLINLNIREHDNDEIIIPSSVKEIDLYAIPYCSCKKLVIPESVTSFDVPRQILHSYSNVDILEFKGKLSSLIAEEEKNPKYMRIKRYLINNTIDNVNVENADAQRDDSFIFLPTVNASLEPGNITLTRSGATIMPGRNGFMPHRRFGTAQNWATPITINVQYIAYVNPILLECYEPHRGCELLLLGKDTKDDSNEGVYPVVYVYEDYETVMNLLKQIGWTEKKH